MGREKITSKSIEMVNLGQQKQKNDNYTKFIDMIKNDSLSTDPEYEYSLSKTLKWRICDFFKYRSLEQRAEKSVERTVKNKSATCWDLALGMHNYLTKKKGLESWICGYSICPGIPHVFNLVDFFIYKYKGKNCWYATTPFEDLKYVVNKSYNCYLPKSLLDKIEKDTVHVAPALIQIDPLVTNSACNIAPKLSLLKFKNANKPENWYVMDNHSSHKWAKFHDFATKVVTPNERYEYYEKKIQVNYKYRGWTFF